MSDAFELQRVLSVPLATKRDAGFCLTVGAVYNERVLCGCDDGALRIYGAEGVGDDSGRELRLLETLPRFAAPPGKAGAAGAGGGAGAGIRALQVVAEWGVLLALVGACAAARAGTFAGSSPPRTRSCAPAALAPPHLAQQRPFFFSSARRQTAA